MNRRITEGRRLRNDVIKDERRHMIRRNLEEFRRNEQDRRTQNEPIAEERRKELRRKEEIEKLLNENPESTIPLQP